MTYTNKTDLLLTNKRNNLQEDNTKNIKRKAKLCVNFC